MSALRPRFLLTVLGGFLGAGKTTWLRHHLHSGVFRDAIVIVNEAASAPVDHMLLASADRIHVLAGGCACCEGKGELLRLLRDLSASTRINETSGIQRIVLETSGLADPQSILAAIACDQKLSGWIEVTEVVVIVDAVNGLELLRDDELARRQIASADCLIVAKTDAVEFSGCRAPPRRVEEPESRCRLFRRSARRRGPAPRCRSWRFQRGAHTPKRPRRRSNPHFGNSSRRHHVACICGVAIGAAARARRRAFARQRSCSRANRSVAHPSCAAACAAARNAPGPGR